MVTPMDPFIYSVLLKTGYVVVFVTSFLVILNAILSAKEMGGTLGMGMKKIAAGTVAQTILIVTYLLLEQGNRGLISDEQVSFFFVSLGILGSVFLILGYLQIYRITRRLKLFTL